jgi:hypothetical protein
MCECVHNAGQENNPSDNFVHSERLQNSVSGWIGKQLADADLVQGNIGKDPTKNPLASELRLCREIVEIANEGAANR